MKNDDHLSYQEIILIDDAYFSELINAINQAKKTIDMETYIYAEDNFGKQVAESLCQAAKRGVKIRLLVDGIGTRTWSGKITKKLEDAGIATRVFHPLPWLISHWHLAPKSPSSILAKIIHFLSNINLRNHRKVCILDQRIVFIGSANIVNHQLAGSTGENWRDTTVKLINVDTTEMQFAFEIAWGDIPLKKRFIMTFTKINLNPIFILNFSRRRRKKIYKALLNRIGSCQKRIWITNAYFFPDDFILKKLVTAAKQGVDVKLLLTHTSDVFISSLASKTFYSILLRHGVSIYEYLPSMMHTKILILDDWFSVGSSNLNYRSLIHDLEVDVNIRSKHAKEILTQQFLDDLKSSTKISFNDIEKLPLYKKIFGRLILYLRYWL